MTIDPTFLLVRSSPGHEPLALQMLLAEAGFDGLRTLTVDTVDGAVDLLARVPVDAVLVAAGPEAEAQVSTVGRLRTVDPSLPLLAVVDSPDIDIAEGLLDAGANDYLQRHELSPALLATVLGAAVARRRQEAPPSPPGRYDPLTGLLSQGALIELLGRLLDRRDRRPDYRFAVIALDVADFYAIRQRIGHPASDELLVALSHRLLASARPIDAVGRLPDAEFVLVLPEVDQPDAARAVARRLGHTLGAPFALSRDELTVTPRWGLSLSNDPYDGPHDMLGAAVLESKTFWAA
ncbi:MAG: diguanylate cyclase [Acidobacteriota bacterium]